MGELIYPQLSYLVTGLCFEAHNELGRYCREKQYGDFLERRFKELKIPYKRELAISGTGNTVDFLVENKIILELKNKRMVTREDYYQIQRYLQAAKIKLGLLVNFRDRYLKPLRIVRIDTSAGRKFK